MREIIAYARSRQVTIVPEIDLPGHSYAAMHAYGDLICDGVDFPWKGKRPGRRLHGASGNAPLRKRRGG